MAHPDDEALGMGGTLIRHSLKEMSQHIILSEGEDAKHKSNIKILKEKRCAKRLSLLIAIYINYLTSLKLDTVPRLKLVKVIEKAVEKIKLI